MANYRQIHVSIWKDEWFLDLEPEEKLLFIYLFSNEATSLAGIYKLPMKVIQFETGLDRKFIEDTLTKFQMVGKVLYENGIVWVTKMRQYHETKSAKVQIRILSDIGLIPDCPLKRRYLYGIDTSPQLNEDEDEDEKEEELMQPPSAARISAVGMFCRVTNMAAFPGTQLQYVNTVQSMLEMFGEERTEVAMRNQYTIWCNTQRKDGSGNYRGTNLVWIDWAQAELAGSPAADLRQKDPKDMTSEEWEAYVLALGEQA